MTKFLVTYHGGSMPQDQAGREQAMAAFADWITQMGESLVDPGAPLGPSVTVSAGGAQGSPDDPVAGYSIIEAPDLDTAAALVNNHPFVKRGGTLKVIESVTP